MGARWAAIRRGTGDLPPVLDGLYTGIDAMRPDLLTLVSTKVSIAGDVTGNGRAWSQGTDALRPTYSAAVAALGGRPGFVFDGLASVLAGVDASALTAGECLCVFQVANDPPATGLKSGLYRFGTAAGVANVPYTDGVIYEEFGSTLQKMTGNPAATMTTQTCYQVFSGAGTWGNAVNGTSLLSTGTNTVGFSATAKLGAGTTNFLDGSIGCFYMWNRKLTTAERASCLAWSRYRWGTP